MGRNHINTVPFVNRFMGLNGDCTEQLAIERSFVTNHVEIIPENKKIFIKLENKGEIIWLFPEQIYGAFLHKLRQFFSTSAERPDVVISVPPYYSTVERQAVLDACKIANVNCVKLVNEDTAVALSYGFFRRKEFDEKEGRNVAFFDFGHAKTTVTIASFTQKKVKILSRRCDRN
jgi:heat shock protein 4